MSSSDPIPVKRYQDVLQAADRGADVLHGLPAAAHWEGAHDWAQLRSDAADLAIARIAVATASGVLVDYEAAVRALIGEAVPLSDPPDELIDLAHEATALLDDLALRFQRTLSATEPEPRQTSTALRNAYSLHAGPWVRNPLTVVELPAVRAADAGGEAAVVHVPPSAAGLEAFASRDPNGIEVVVTIPAPEEDLLVPLAVTDPSSRRELLVLASQPSGYDTWSGNVVVPSVGTDTVAIEFGTPLDFAALRPQHAELVRTSVALNPAGVRDRWLAHLERISWTGWLIAGGLDDPRRD